MENIYGKCSESEQDEIIHGLETSFNGHFEKLVEKIEECKTEGSGSIVSCSDRDTDRTLQNEQIESQSGVRKSQANSKIVQRNLELHLR